ncbi:disease resistance protein Roq1-like [Ziziphus jujuba]|uniref:ADP-ribosyl cyclase/cyclic ADP-ribose hydrolase n=1 Tax=Ziziphus jujuba TaxID=326968 RepID=A0ABM4AAQ6_ZIZJJ|nr:disease resistance protein Roq1-like [Ziziphus jujuba]
MTNKVNAATNAFFPCSSPQYRVTETQRFGQLTKRVSVSWIGNLSENNKRWQNGVGEPSCSNFIGEPRCDVGNRGYKHMVASSSSSSSSREKYEVFLSFRGEDTRDGFIGHLYNALCQKHILIYKDDEYLEGGLDISEIMEAIRGSKICITVFSKDFASSTWCLDEVIRIHECERNGNDVISIFYGIEPFMVRKQEENYAASFNKYEQCFEDNMDKVQQWRDALSKVAGIIGYDSKKGRPEYKLIEKIVEDVLWKLSKYGSTNDHFKRHLIGTEKPVKEIKGLLCIGSANIRIIGLYGVAGLERPLFLKLYFKVYLGQGGPLFEAMSSRLLAVCL